MQGHWLPLAEKEETKWDKIAELATHLTDPLIGYPAGQLYFICQWVQHGSHAAGWDPALDKLKASDLNEAGYFYRPKI